MADQTVQTVPLRVKADVDHGTDGCLLVTVLFLGVLLLGASIDSAGGKIARAIDRYTDKVTTATRTP